MTNSDFLLTIDGEVADVRSLMCHFQEEPYPGGRTYQLIIRDRHVLSTAKKEFGLGAHREPDASRQGNFLSYLFPVIGIICGRTDIRFWANRIAEIEVSEDKVLLKGICSPQARAGVQLLPRNFTLLKQFLAEDADSQIRRRLMDAIQNPNVASTLQFTSNRFNILIAFETKQVTIQDDLTVGPDGECKLGFDEFVSALTEPCRKMR